jgi:hypothetical protein
MENGLKARLMLNRLEEKVATASSVFSWLSACALRAEQ